MAKKSFEQALQLLEKIVQELESGDLPLEKAMSQVRRRDSVDTLLFPKAGRDRTKDQPLASGPAGKCLKQTF